MTTVSSMWEHGPNQPQHSHVPPSFSLWLTIKINLTIAWNTWGVLHTLTDFYRVTGGTVWVLFYWYSNIQEYSILGLSLVAQDQITHFPPICNRNYGIFIFVMNCPSLSYSHFIRRRFFFIIINYYHHHHHSPVDFVSFYRKTFWNMSACIKDSIQLLEQLFHHSYILTCKGKFGNITLPSTFSFTNYKSLCLSPNTTKPSYPKLHLHPW